MSSQDDLPKGSIQRLATGLFVLGLALNLVNLLVLDHDRSWISWTAITLMGAGVLLSIWLLFAHSRKRGTSS